jgi:hypothetical protein
MSWEIWQRLTVESQNYEIFEVSKKCESPTRVLKQHHSHNWRLIGSSTSTWRVWGFGSGCDRGWQDESSMDYQIEVVTTSIAETMWKSHNFYWVVHTHNSSASRTYALRSHGQGGHTSLHRLEGLNLYLSYTLSFSKVSGVLYDACSVYAKDSAWYWASSLVDRYMGIWLYARLWAWVTGV